MSTWRSRCVGVVALIVWFAAGCAETAKKVTAPAMNAAESRWQADPFANTKAIEVRRNVLGGESRTTSIDDPAVVAALMGTLRVTAIDNGVSIGSIPPAFVTFHKEDDSALATALEDATRFSTHGALIYVEPGFVAALNEQTAASLGRRIDLPDAADEPATRRLPAAQKFPPEPSLKSLEAGFHWFEMKYRGGKEPPFIRRARITDPFVLEDLRTSLKVVAQEPFRRINPTIFAVFTAASKDGSHLNCRLHDATTLAAFRFGIVTIEPTFVKTLNRHLSRLEGREVDVLGLNPPTLEQADRAAAFRARLSSVKRIRFTSPGVGDGRPVLIKDPAKVANLLKKLTWVEPPLRQHKAKKGTLVIELLGDDGTDPLTLTYLDAGPDGSLLDVQPAPADLADVSGFGQLFVDKQWRERLIVGHLDSIRRDRKEQVHEATTDSVCRDLGGFLPQVLSISVTYRQGDDQLRTCLTARESKPLIDALAIKRVEKLDWSSEKWLAEVRRLDRAGAGRLELTPGLGYSLTLMFAGERELLIPRYGRVALKRNPIDAIRAAVADDARGRESIHLLPR